MKDVLKKMENVLIILCKEKYDNIDNYQKICSEKNKNKN